MSRPVDVAGEEGAGTVLLGRRRPTAAIAASAKEDKITFY
jgi:hypothetical protein